MKIIKQGTHRLFDQDPETSRIVSEMLCHLERRGMDAVREYSRKFDDWEPESFELSPRQIQEIISRLPDQVLRDTDYCQSNVRRFAEAQLATMLPLEIE